MDFIALSAYSFILKRQYRWSILDEQEVFHLDGCASVFGSFETRSSILLSVQYVYRALFPSRSKQSESSQKPQCLLLVREADWHFAHGYYKLMVYGIASCAFLTCLFIGAKPPSGWEHFKALFVQVLLQDALGLQNILAVIVVILSVFPSGLLGSSSSSLYGWTFFASWHFTAQVFCVEVNQRSKLHFTVGAHSSIFTTHTKCTATPNDWSGLHTQTWLTQSFIVCNVGYFHIFLSVTQLKESGTRGHAGAQAKIHCKSCHCSFTE